MASKVQKSVLKKGGRGARLRCPAAASDPVAPLPLVPESRADGGGEQGEPPAAAASLRIYYICMAGISFPCRTLIRSDCWNKRHDDPNAAGQRWYCPECGARYRSKFGVVCEIIYGPNDVRYFRVECPPFDMKDTKFISINHFSYCRVECPDFDMKDTKFIPIDETSVWRAQEIPGKEGHYHIDEEAYERLGPMLKWNDLIASLAKK